MKYNIQTRTQSLSAVLDKFSQTEHTHGTITQTKTPASLALLLGPFQQLSPRGIALLTLTPQVILPISQMSFNFIEVKSNSVHSFFSLNSCGINRSQFIYRFCYFRYLSSFWFGYITVVLLWTLWWVTFGEHMCTFCQE